jgi:hypothetical protein
MPTAKIDPKDNPILKAGKNYEAMLKELGTISAVMRALNAEGYKRADIARFCGRIYQHVKNVLDAEVTRKEVAKEQAAKKAVRDKAEASKQSKAPAKKAA